MAAVRGQNFPLIAYKNVSCPEVQIFRNIVVWNLNLYYTSESEIWFLNLHIRLLPKYNTSCITGSLSSESTKLYSNILSLNCNASHYFCSRHFSLKNWKQPQHVHLTNEECVSALISNVRIHKQNTYTWGFISLVLDCFSRRWWIRFKFIIICVAVFITGTILFIIPAVLLAIHCITSYIILRYYYIILQQKVPR